MTKSKDIAAQRLRHGLIPGGYFPGMADVRKGGPGGSAPPITEQLVAQYDALSLTGYSANDPIETWPESHNSEDAVQEVLAAQGTYNDNVAGTGKPGVEFSGGQFYRCPTTLQIPPNMPSTVYAVGTGTSTSAFQVAFAWSNSSSQIAYLLDNRVGWRVGTGGGGNGDTRWHNGAHRRVTGVNDTSQHRLYVDRTLEMMQSTGSQQPSGDFAVMIGARNAGDGSGEFFWTGSLQEILLFKEAHTAAQRAEIWNYLGAKWGFVEPVHEVPIPSENIYAQYDAMALEDYSVNDPVVIWHDAANDNDATQDVLASQGTFVDDVGGTGKPAVEFSGGQFYVLPDALKLDPTDPIHIFMAIDRTSGGTSASWVSWREPGMSGYQVLQVTANRAIGLLGDGNTGTTENDKWPNGRATFTVSGNGAGTPLTMRHAGIEIGSATMGSGTPDMARLALIGARDDGTGTPELYVTGLVHEIIFATGDVDIADVESYLTNKWDL